MRIITKRTAALTKFIDAKAAADQAIRELKLAEEDLIETLRESGKKSVSITEGDKVRRATFVQKTTTQIDEEGLRKAVGVKIWNRITDRKVSRTKLTEFINDGQISPEQVSSFLSTKESKPYVYFSEGQRKDEEDRDDE